jgi:L-threonylcarbamoyladenylate synthase
MRATTDPQDAAAALAAGHLAALPTETVYGLGARADDPHAIARIYAAKGRPADHPLIVHLADIDALDAWGTNIPIYAYQLARAFWPGPITLVINRSLKAADFITGGQDSVAVRVSVHPLMQEVQQALILLTGDPAIGIAAPSANRFGRVSPTNVQHVLDELGAYTNENDVVLDGGDCAVGVESTIIDCTGDHPRLLRPGAVSLEQVQAITGLPCTTDSTVRASGTLESHYSPVAVVELITEAQLLNRDFEDATVGLIALAAIPTPAGAVRLCAPQTVSNYAQQLYAALREADALQLTSVLAIPPSQTGIGAAIVDRLTRAAHAN